VVVLEALKLESLVSNLESLVSPKQVTLSVLISFTSCSFVEKNLLRSLKAGGAVRNRPRAHRQYERFGCNLQLFSSVAS